MTEQLLEHWVTSAEEFGRWVSGWRTRFLVASCVEKGTGGRRLTVTNVTVKVSAREFAERAHVSVMTVTRAYNEWEKAYDQGAPIPPAILLVPGQEIDLAPVEAWEPEAEEKPPGKPFNAASDIITAGGKRILAARDVTDLTEQDCYDLERPLTDAEACIGDVRVFLKNRIKELQNK